jgi:hypothetical protein
LILSILTHGGREYEAEVTSYDPIKLNEDINNKEINTVLIGDVILSRIDIKAIFEKDEI